MKRLILALVVSSGLAGAHAQLLSPEAFSGALLGTVIGGFAGGSCHDGFSGQGGLQLGALHVDSQQPQSRFALQASRVIAPRCAIHILA